MRMHETSSAKWSNTITYPDDVKFQTWSFGYYLNIADSACRRYAICSTWKGDLAGQNFAEWTRHCDLLENALNVLESQLTA